MNKDERDELIKKLWERRQAEKAKRKGHLPWWGVIWCFAIAIAFLWLMAAHGCRVEQGISN